MRGTTSNSETLHSIPLSALQTLRSIGRTRPPLMNFQGATPGCISADSPALFHQPRAL